MCAEGLLILQKSNLLLTDNVLDFYPLARRMEHPLLADKHGTVFDVYKVELGEKFILIVDYRFAIYRPDRLRFFKEPWLNVAAFLLSEEAFEKSLEVIQFNSVQEREME